MKKIGKFALIFALLLIIFIGLLVVACSFPSSEIKKNVVTSALTLNEEGNRKFVFIFDKLQVQEFDNFSDALMINTAYSIDSKTPMYSAFTAKKNYIPGVTKTIEEDVVGELKSSSEYKGHNEVAELKGTLIEDISESFEYAKYWHGYLAILRPLLLVLDYQQIRVLITLVLALLAIFSTTMIAEKKNNIIATFYLLSLVFVEYFYIGLSLLNSITFLITMITSCIMIAKYKEIRNWDVVFFIVGMFIAFFALLDTPFLALGSMLILYFLFKEEKGTVKELIKLSFYWFLGYGLTWLSKWVLMDLIYHRTLIKTAVGQVFYRSVGEFNIALPLLAVCVNLLSMAIPLMITIIIIMYYYAKYMKNITKETREKGRIFAIIGLLPFLWMLIISNHSAMHFIFVYRLFFISMFSLLLWVYYICGCPEKHKIEH